MPRLMEENSFKLRKWVESVTEESIIEYLKAETIFGTCWLWTGYTFLGYGVIGKYGFQVHVHRLSATVYHKLPHFDLSLKALHKPICLNRNCWNPEHLYVGTQAQNVRDAIEAGNHISAIKRQATHCQRGHPFDEVNTGWNSKGRRFCRICIRVSQKDYAQKKRDRIKNGCI